jgi:uncharacterized protein YodC (DUF2158 family)
MADNHDWLSELTDGLGSACMKAGDIVQLKVGGPPMAVQDVLTDGWVSCVWFKKREVYVYDFHSKCLVRLEAHDG